MKITFLFNYIAKSSKLYYGSGKNSFIENVDYVVDFPLCEVAVYQEFVECFWLFYFSLNKFAPALIDICATTCPVIQ